MAGQQLVVDNVVLRGTTIKEMDYRLGPCTSNYSINSVCPTLLEALNQCQHHNIDYCQHVCAYMHVCLSSIVQVIGRIINPYARRDQNRFMRLYQVACVSRYAGQAGFVLT